MPERYKHQPTGNPILCLDFDGCIHSYERGWQNGVIYGDVVPGFFDWAERAAKYFKLVIFSTRSRETKGRNEMINWLRTKAKERYAHSYVTFDVGQPPVLILQRDENQPIELEFVGEKPPAFLSIDDRTICFDGDWAGLQPEELREFKPWMHRQGTFW